MTKDGDGILLYLQVGGRLGQGDATGDQQLEGGIEGPERSARCRGCVRGAGEQGQRSVWVTQGTGPRSAGPLAAWRGSVAPRPCCLLAVRVTLGDHFTSPDLLAF